MLLSTIAFFILLVFVVLLPSGGLYWYLSEKRKVSFNSSVACSVFLALIVGVSLFTLKTTVIVIDAQHVNEYAMLGQASFTFSNGTITKIDKLEHGEIILNDSEDTCVIKRVDYNEEASEEDIHLLSIVLLVKPQESYAFHGNKIDYFFVESPDYLKKKRNTSSHELVKFELQYLTEAAKQEYGLYDGPVKYGIPEGEGKYWFSNGDYYKGSFEKGYFEGAGEMDFAETGKSLKGDWHHDKYVGE